MRAGSETVVVSSLKEPAKQAAPRVAAARHKPQSTRSRLSRNCSPPFVRQARATDTEHHESITSRTLASSGGDDLLQI